MAAATFLRHCRFRLSRLSSTPLYIVPARTATVLRRIKPHRDLSLDITYEIPNKNSPDDPVYLRYEIVEESETEVPEVKVILLKSNEEYGQRGQIVVLPSELALKELLLPGQAVYASPDNLEQYKDIVIPEDSFHYSSETARLALPRLSKVAVPLVMNGAVPWTIQPWHVRAALRTVGVEVENESAVEIPAKPISGPSPHLQGKEFLIHVVVNGRERVANRCVLFQTSEMPEDAAEGVLNLGEKLPPDGWNYMFNEPVFEEERKTLYLLPREEFPEGLTNKLPQLLSHLETYKMWKKTREKELYSD